MRDRALDRSDGFLAVDVVLLPPDEVSDKAIEINKELSRKFNNRIKLDRKACLPHVTLAMGCIKKSDINIIDEKLAGISKRFPPMDLETISETEAKGWLRIKSIRSLQLLHETIMNELTPLFSYNVTEDILSKKEDEDIDEITIDYIKHFPSESSFRNYTSHITVGSGDMVFKPPKISFSVFKLALCHLGNFCTCRKILLSYNLTKTKEIL